MDFLKLILDLISDVVCISNDSLDVILKSGAAFLVIKAIFAKIKKTKS